MSAREETTELSPAHLEIEMTLFPRRYSRYKDLRSDVGAWARTLDWPNNPYDYFLLRREILRQFEAIIIYEGARNVYTFASRDEISTECDLLMKEYSAKKFCGLDVFTYVLALLPWRLGFKHGRVHHSPLTAALAKTAPSGPASRSGR